MLTRLLRTLGLDLGRQADMMPAAADNPDGFWENLRFVQLNDELLNNVGAAWDLPPSREQAFAQDSLRPLRAKAELLIASFEEDKAWGWKDPRNCLTLPFWQSLLPELKTVIIVRNPLEAAYSMHRRNGTSYALGLRLWEIYNRRLLAHTQPEQRLITNYQAFFENPRSELERLARFAELPKQDITATADLVTQTRRHTTFTQEQLIDAGVSEDIIGLYTSMVAQATATDGAGGDTAQLRSDQDATESNASLAGSANYLNLTVPESENVRRELAQRRGSEIQHQENIQQLQARIE
ncbi:MAG: sulfotransferase family protein, partial [Bryobacteraceae bacterium]